MNLVRKWFTYILLGTNILAVLVLHAVRLEWPHPFWASAATAAVFVSTLVAAQSVFVELGERRQRKRLQLQEDVRASLSAALGMIADRCRVPFQQLGVQCFEVSWSGCRRCQARLAKVRLSNVPSSGVKWRRGKGVIGLCWETRRLQWVDLSQGPFAQLAQMPDDRWPAVDLNTSYGLSFSDYRTLGNKYGIVAAAPIIVGDQYIGCITLDVPPGVDVPNREFAEQTLATTAELAGRMIMARKQ